MVFLHAPCHSHIDPKLSIVSFSSALSASHKYLILLKSDRGHFSSIFLLALVISALNRCCNDADCQSTVKQCVRGKCEPLQCAPTLDGANGKLVTAGSRELGKSATLVCDDGHYYPRSPFARKVEIFCDKKLNEMKWTQFDGSDFVSCIKGSSSFVDYFFVELAFH